MNAGTVAEIVAIRNRHERDQRERDASTARLAGHEEHVDRGILLSIVDHLVREIAVDEEAADVWKNMYRALKDGSEARQNLAHAKDMEAQRDEARAALERLGDALLGLPGEEIRYGPGFSVAEYCAGCLYDVIDGDGDALAQCKSSEVAAAIADVCNEATK